MGLSQLQAGRAGLLIRLVALLLLWGTVLAGWSASRAGGLLALAGVAVVQRSAKQIELLGTRGGGRRGGDAK